MDDASTGPTSKPVKFEDFAADIARRREAAGNSEMPPNSGKRRTASKRALLKAIEDAGGSGELDIVSPELPDHNRP